VPFCASVIVGVSAATKTIAAAAHAHLSEKRNQTIKRQDQPEAFFISPPEVTPNVRQAKMSFACKRNLRGGNSACNPMRDDRLSKYRARDKRA